MCVCGDKYVGKYDRQTDRETASKNISRCLEIYGHKSKPVRIKSHLQSWLLAIVKN